MANIPLELWREILIQIRAEGLIGLRCVCSSWRNLIDCPTFRVQHSTRPSNFLAQNLILFSRDAYYILGLENISPDNVPISDPISNPIRATVVRIKIGNQINGLDQWNNGLVLRYDCANRRHFAWNPLTRRHQNLHVTDLIKERGRYLSNYGIGFDEFSRDCKVVFISTHIEKISTDVYVRKLRSPSCWKLMDPLPLPKLLFNHIPRRDGVFISGALHWMVQNDNGISVLAIDLGTEKYRLMPLPLDQISSVDFPSLQLCVLGGCLCMSFHNFRSGIPHKFEAWVMKEYEFINSWSNLYVVKSEELGFQIHTPSKPVTYSGCGSEVLISFNGDLVWYHLQNKTVKHIELEGWQDPKSWENYRWVGLRRSFTAIEYVGSFLPIGCDAMELEIPATMQPERKLPYKN